MNIFPTQQEFLALARQGNLIPVCADLMADFETPVSVFSKLRRQGIAYLLESIEGGARLNRYSFIGCRPRRIYRSTGGTTEMREGESGPWLPVPDADPLDALRREMQSYRPVDLPGMPRFTGGAVGYLGYEYVHQVESTVPPASDDPLEMPTAWFMISDQVVIFDRARQTLRLLVNARIPEGGDPQAAYRQAVEDLEGLAAILQEPASLAALPVEEAPSGDLPPGNFTREQFEAMVERTREYIRAGDIIQCVLSQRFEQAARCTPLELYRTLRTVNPSPYMFLLDTDAFSLIGASPEVHVRLTGAQVEIRPIAGTRPRGVTFEEDIANERSLLADEKERAEHLMLADLARNDIGRVCQWGSVTVPEYMVVERYSHVMHIVSQVEGLLREDRDCYDLMRATFPAGTVSGAPKVRAMQIISELEGQKRGPYAGAVTYFSYNGNLDSCIAIRTALMKGGRLFIQSGAGLVADSVPANEYMETVNKARGMLKAVAMAEKLNATVRAQRRGHGRRNYSPDAEGHA